MDRISAAPDILTVDERLHAIARILAGGILRLHARAALPASTGDAAAPNQETNSSSNCLDVPGETRLSDHSG
jgi:hypothetical protein